VTHGSHSRSVGGDARDFVARPGSVAAAVRSLAGGFVGAVLALGYLGALVWVLARYGAEVAGAAVSLTMLLVVMRWARR